MVTVVCRPVAEEGVGDGGGDIYSPARALPVDWAVVCGAARHDQALLPRLPGLDHRHPQRPVGPGRLERGKHMIDVPGGDACAGQ